MNCLLKCYLCVFTGAGSLNAHSLTCCYTSPSQCRCQAVEFTFKSKNNVGLQTITLTPVPLNWSKTTQGRNTNYMSLFVYSLIASLLYTVTSISPDHKFLIPFFQILSKF